MNAKDAATIVAVDQVTAVIDVVSGTSNGLDSPTRTVNLKAVHLLGLTMMMGC